MRTRLTERLGIELPIISAPMGFLAGGRLAAAVSSAGGLGLIGGGYGDRDWLDRAFAAAGNIQVGCGFITWSLAKQPELLDQVLARSPTALMLSFGSPSPFAARIRQSGATLICQVQSMANAREAVDAGADVIVAQGGEAGGHGGTRGTLTLVPEVADFLAAAAPDTLLVAAGGIADGRGLAAALMLGADGVLIGSRLVASLEAETPQGFHDAIVVADGDATVKTTVVDVVRGYPWSAEFSGRALRNSFVRSWHGREHVLAEPATNAVERERYWKMFRSGDADNTGVFIGEAAGLIRDVRPAGEILKAMVAEAEALLQTGPGMCVGRSDEGNRVSSHGSRVPLVGLRGSAERSREFRHHHVVDVHVAREPPTVGDRHVHDAGLVGDRQSGSAERVGEFDGRHQLVVAVRPARKPAQHVFGADDGKNPRLHGPVDRGGDHHPAGLQRRGARGDEGGYVVDVLDHLEDRHHVEAFAARKPALRS